MENKTDLEIIQEILNRSKHLSTKAQYVVYGPDDEDVSKTLVITTSTGRIEIPFDGEGNIQ